MPEQAASGRGRSLLVCLAPALVVLAGCGGNGGATVSGTVTLDGVPLGKGSLEFRNLQGTGIVALVPIADGAFHVAADAELPPGTFRIVINSPQKSGRQIPAGSPAPPGTMVDEVIESIPRRYNEASELERTVAPGPNTLDFDLVK
ncbi:MAG: hypothetical protein ACKOEM_08410 [Planctomycetia bacterium]